MPMSISEVARLTGLSIHTLRYYDECGLVSIREIIWDLNKMV